MSRIHEALKKAEQERAATQGNALPTSYATTPVAEPLVFEEKAAVTPSAPASHAGMAAFASPFSIDTMLARCTQREWKPETGTMLFMNGDDSARGTEEFRTLRSRLYHLREKMTLKKIL